MDTLKPGLSHTSFLDVTADKLALSLGSGDLPVLATPAMMALMENAAMTAVAAHLPEGSTTVGSEISSTHLRPTVLGGRVSATALLVAVDGRRLDFAVQAQDADGNLLGKGTHTRYVVDRLRFMEKLKK
ncbi:MAG: thioesterase family protein [Bacteroidaceae bacterium]|nr:thioesterase family protein [Bacteroidaceae bacterium]